jgi:hypothetical protein
MRSDGKTSWEIDQRPGSEGPRPPHPAPRTAPPHIPRARYALAVL